MFATGSYDHNLVVWDISERVSRHTTLSSLFTFSLSLSPPIEWCKSARFFCVLCSLSLSDPDLLLIVVVLRLRLGSDCQAKHGQRNPKHLLRCRGESHRCGIEGRTNQFSRFQRNEERVRRCLQDTRTQRGDHLHSVKLPSRPFPSLRRSLPSLQIQSERETLGGVVGELLHRSVRSAAETLDPGGLHHPHSRCRVPDGLVS